MNNDICVLERSHDGAHGGRTRRRLRSRRQVSRALAGSVAGDVWVLRSQESAAGLVRAMTDGPPGVRRARVIAYKRPGPLLAQIIESGFDRVLLGAGAMIPFEELTELLDVRHPEDHAIGAEWDQSSDTLAIWRGDLSVLLLPMSAFPARGGVAPDPAALSIEDFGQTLRMGKYEASVDSLLYERDPEYRRRAKKRMIATEQGLGPSIRRLRTLRGVGRDDFPGIDAKTIARIERGEVAHPHAGTLRTIAARLEVAVEDLGAH